jgi:FKBP-type peptidyl-prolyl cis-trans isomerase
MPRLRLLTTLPVIALALGASGCGGGDDKGSSALDQNTTQTQTQPAQKTIPDDKYGVFNAKKVKPTAGEADIRKKPQVRKGTGTPPPGMIVQDLIVGKGKKKAKAGQDVSVQYVGVLFQDGTEFDASWKGDRPGKPFRFPLGQGRVIPGWDQGVVGMKVGGRRKLVIPAQLAYGAQGFPPDIPPDATLIFDIDLKKIGR